MKVKFENFIGKIKPMNAVNNGPGRKTAPDSPYAYRSTFGRYKEANIPFARNHDASISRVYGGCHTVDIQNIFMDFDADVYDAENYDFVHTDELIKRTLDAGTETFYRLGTAIEGNFLKHYGTIPPKDFSKWAAICEHIIHHENYGWADGNRFGIRYWEIWNEPDPWGDTERNPNTWDGTKEQFFELYGVAAKHLKKCFPDIKIGGPALASNLVWAEQFIAYCKENEVPLDFFSWHIYTSDVSAALDRAEKVREILDRYRFDKTESILNEWNFEPLAEPHEDRYIRFRNNVGGAFVADMMLRCQHSSTDMLMYYDARPGTSYNGLFDFYTGKPFCAYYALYDFGKLYSLGKESEVVDVPNGISAVAACDGAENGILMLSYYDKDEGTDEKSFEVSLGEYEAVSVSITDSECENTVSCACGNKLCLTMKPNSFVLIEAKRK